ncbi:MAG: CoA transferase [Acidimicrobiia bacterium]|jgi:crotonobetainyl-CoA:carnitine CoA-transferase CaiB-like acyl-CoA transferase
MPLSGILVADFSRVLAAPLVSMTLADLGADVVKVERPESGDDTRAWGPPWAGDGSSSYYLALNRGKRSVVLDLGHPHDLELARRLGERADVLVENFRVGFMDDLGLGFETLSAANPGLVYCSVSGFGAEGSVATLPGYDLLIQAMSGMMSITGQSADSPTKVGAAVIDMAAGLYATIGVLAALHERLTTNRGRHVEVSLFDAALNALLNQGSGFLNSGVVPTAQGNRHPSIAPYEVFRAADRDFVLAAANDKLWQRTCTVLGRDDLATDARFRTNADRRGNVDDLAGELNRAFAARPAHEWIDALRASGIPAGPINRIDEAFIWATDAGLDPTVEYPAVGGRAVRSPIRLDGSPATSPLPPPGLDEHGDEIRRWLTQEGA